MTTDVWLFSYGTLQQDEVQLATFGRLLEGRKDALPGYATTLFDYTRRAMPLNNPLSLTSDEVYAVTAYVLYLNGIIGENAQMNAQTLPQVKMPNRDGFVDMSRK